jgi:hypothetical protein
MKHKKSIEQRVQGWIPEDQNALNRGRIAARVASRKRRLVIVTGASAVFVVCALLLLSFIMMSLNPIVPTDVKIYDTVNGNKDLLLNISSVVGAGIARNSTDNHIIGIAVYIANNAIDTQDVPKTLGDFTVIIKSIDEANELEKEHMIIRREDTQ